jgi:putative transcriptional regulator
MSEIHPDLAAPTLLIAMPQVLDPFFHKSVVLLVHHDEEGSFGFIVNRPTDIRVAEILNGMEIVWQGNDNALAYFGGPVQPQLGTVLYAPAAAETRSAEGASEVCPGVSITQHIGDLAELAENPPASLRLLLGYAGWGEGQLVEEILRNDWLVGPVQTDLIFCAEPDTVWAAALEAAGVDPASLPSWTSGGDEGSTN